MKLLIIGTFLTLVILISNLIIDKSIAVIGSQYDGTSLASCLNDKLLKTSNNIIVGTSSSRELTLANENLRLKQGDYFICGVSTPTMSLDFQFLILNLLHNSISIDEKNILIELSVQSALASNSIFETDTFERFLSIAPIDTKVFWLKNYIMTGNYSAEGNRGALLTLKYIMFPSISLRNVSFSLDSSTRENGYLEKIFTIQDFSIEQLSMFKANFDFGSVSRRLDGILDYGQSAGAEIGILIPPVNEYYVEISENDTNFDAIDEFYRTLNSKLIVIDLRFLDDLALFADCCHLNRFGQSELLKFRSELSWEF